MNWTNTVMHKSGSIYSSTQAQKTVVQATWVQSLVKSANFLIFFLLNSSNSMRIMEKLECLCQIHRSEKLLLSSFIYKNTAVTVKLSNITL